MLTCTLCTTPGAPYAVGAVDVDVTFFPGNAVYKLTTTATAPLKFYPAGSTVADGSSATSCAKVSGCTLDIWVHLGQSCARATCAADPCQMADVDVSGVSEDSKGLMSVVAIS